MDSRPPHPSFDGREALLDSAELTFAERGFSATGVREVAGRAGVAHGLVRHHFASKEGLWRAVVDRAADRYLAAMGPHATSVFDVRADIPTDVRAAAQEAARGFLEVSMRHPHVVRLLLHEAVAGGTRLDYVLTRFRAVATIMAPLLPAARRAGLLRQFDQESLFLFMLTAGAMPFALPGLAEGLLGTRLDRDAEASARHVERILVTLFG